MTRHLMFFDSESSPLLSADAQWSDRIMRKIEEVLW
jgi:hypothetical protein